MTCLPTCVPYEGTTVSGIAHDPNCPDQHAASTSSCGVDHGSGTTQAITLTFHDGSGFVVSGGRAPHCATCRCTS